MDEVSISQLFNDALEVLTSPEALWFYSWLLVAAIFVVSVLFGVYQLRSIRSFSGADLKKTHRGRKPIRSAAIRSRIADAWSHVLRTVARLSLRATLMILFGVVIPGSLLIVIAWNQDWFMPGELVFLVSGEPSPAQNLSVVELFLFAVDQALRGGLTDLFEVFGLSIGSVSNNPGNVVFSSLVLGFRVLCGAVTVGLIALFARVALGIWGVHEDVQQLAADLPDQVSA